MTARIKPEELKHLLQPFVRGDSARSTSGTGLGLAIVQRIIDAHDGELDIGTSERGGLLIRAYIPLPMEKKSRPTAIKPPGKCLTLLARAALLRPRQDFLLIT